MPFRAIKKAETIIKIKAYIGLFLRSIKWLQDTILHLQEIFQKGGV